MTPLIDATEMYLRTVWELEEEGITPIRARLVERLNLSAPAVSETVARLEEEGLMGISPNRTLELTDYGRRLAIGVMRKHRLAELLLTDMIGMDWEYVHNEACRWEHVMSDAAEERIAAVLGDPPTCPHGNPIPDPSSPAEPAALLTMAEAAKVARADLGGGPEVATGGQHVVTVQRISEQLQSDVEALRFLRTRGLRPGARIALSLMDGQVHATSADAGDEGDGPMAVPELTADLVYVSAS